MNSNFDGQMQLNNHEQKFTFSLELSKQISETIKNQQSIAQYTDLNNTSISQENKQDKVDEKRHEQQNFDEFQNNIHQIEEDKQKQQHYNEQCEELCQQQKEQEFIQNQQHRQNQYHNVLNIEIIEDDQTLTATTTNSQQQQNQLIENSELKQNNLQEFICILYNNRKSIVQQKFHKELQELIATKKNLGEKQMFDKETKELMFLKGKNITLDITFIDEQNQQFDQIAGRTDLKSLKQSVSNNHLFETYFIILLEKLNKMHELGLAHSDIKPQNIVISYKHEPYFIDFGSSVKLSDYKNYLQHFTFNYNLSVYVKKVNNKQKYQISKFKSEEEIKLCDQTQLALTFLYLLCDESQLNLFLGKAWNDLLKQLDDKNNVNRNIVLAIITRILNQADPSINILGEEHYQTFTIHYNTINEQLFKSEDIVFTKDGFQVNKIDQFSIYLLLLLYHEKYYLIINPCRMIIIPQPELEQYQFICSKYKKIQEYQYSLINYKILNDIDFQNLCEFIKILQNYKLNIHIRDDKNKFVKLIKIIKSINNEKNLQFNLKIDLDSFFKFIDILRTELPNQIISSFFFDKKQVIIKIKRNLNKFQKVKIIFKDWKDIIHESLNHLEYIVQFCKQIDKEINYFIKIKNKLSFKSNKLFVLQELDIIQYVLDQESNQEQKQDKIQQIMDYILRIQIEKKEPLNNQLYNSVQTKIKKALCKDAINESFQCLLQIQKIDKLFQKFTFKFYNFIFEETSLWEEFKKIIENKENKQIEIILVNCQFNQQVSDLIQNIVKMSSCEFPGVQYDDYKLNEDRKLFYTVNIEQTSKFTIESSFKIKFFRDFSKKDQTITKQDNYKPSIQNEKQLNKSPQEFDGLKNILSNQYFQNQILNELNIQCGKQKMVFKIEQNKKRAIIHQNEKEINILIDEINNKINYDKIHIGNVHNIFHYQIIKSNSQIADQVKTQEQRIYIQYDINSNQNTLMSLFKKLYFALYNTDNQSISNLEHQFILIKYSQNYRFQLASRLFNDKFIENQRQKSFYNHYVNYYQHEKKNISLDKFLYLEFQYLNYNEPEDHISIDINNMIQSGKLVEDYESLIQQQEQDYEFINFFLLKDTIKKKKMISYFRFLELSEQSFQVFFTQIQQLKQLKMKYFDFQQCQYSDKTLNFIYETTKQQSEKQIISFNLDNHKISECEFIEFLKKLIYEKPIHEYIFEFSSQINEKLKSIQNEFRNNMKINSLNSQWTYLKYQPEQSQIKSKCRFHIILQSFSDTELIKNQQYYKRQQNSLFHYQDISSDEDQTTKKQNGIQDFIQNYYSNCSIYFNDNFQNLVKIIESDQINSKLINFQIQDKYFINLSEEKIFVINRKFQQFMHFKINDPYLLDQYQLQNLLYPLK